MSEHIYWQDDSGLYKREEIVRCRDCKMFDPKDGAMLACKFEYRGFTQWKLAEPEGFCKWAIRRDA